MILLYFIFLQKNKNKWKQLVTKSVSINAHTKILTSWSLTQHKFKKDQRAY
jgi:hypothetical protein